MSEGLLASQAFWLLGIDDQLRRPKAPHVRIGLAAAALVDLIDAGGIQWTGAVDEPSVEVLPLATDNDLLAVWHARLVEAVTDGGWPRGVRRRRALRAGLDRNGGQSAGARVVPGAPDAGDSPAVLRADDGRARGCGEVRGEVRSALSEARPLEGAAHSLAAVCESSGVGAFVLSERWAPDGDIDLQLTHALVADPLNRRLTEAIGVLLGGAFRVRPFR